MACGSAEAASPATGNFLVQITIEDSCVITSTNNLLFGTHGALATEVTATTTLSVQCTSGLPYSIGLDAGTDGGAIALRKMESPAMATIDYNLFKDPSHTQVWGDTGAELVTGTGTGASVPFTIYGQVPAQSTPAAATYSDTITVTVSW